MGAGNKGIINNSDLENLSRGISYQKYLGKTLIQCLRFGMRSFNHEAWKSHASQVLCDEVVKHELSDKLCLWCNAILLCLNEELPEQ